MTKLMNIDDGLLEAARRALGTTTVDGTVNEAFLRTDEAGGLGRITKEHIEAFTESQETAQPEIMTKACK